MSQELNLDTTALDASVLSKPFAGYKNFADCMAHNKNKKNPRAYCAAIMHQVEGKSFDLSKSVDAGRGPFKFWMQVFKVDKEKRIIAGYASVEAIDAQNEVIPIAALERAWAKFTVDMDYAHINVMHSNIPVGKIIPEYTDSEGNIYRSGPDKQGLFIIVKIRTGLKKADEVWALITSDPPVFRGFSIAGEALLRTPILTADSIHIDRIDELELHEISIVDHPANQMSLFSILKGGLTVEQIQAKLLELIERRRKLDETMYPRSAPPSPEQQVEMAMVSSEIEAYEEALGAAISREELGKTMAKNSKLRGGLTPSGIEPAPSLEQVKGGVEPAPVEHAPSSESNNQEEKRKMDTDKSAKLLALMQQFSQAATAILTSEDKPEPAKADPAPAPAQATPAGKPEEKGLPAPPAPAVPAKTEEKPAPAAAPAEKPEDEKAKKPKEEEKPEDKKPGEMKTVEPAAAPPAPALPDFEKMVNDALEKKLGGQSEQKRTVAPNSTAVVKKDPLSMDLRELNQIPFSRIMKGEF